MRGKGLLLVEKQKVRKQAEKELEEKRAPKFVDVGKASVRALK